MGCFSLFKEHAECPREVPQAFWELLVPMTFAPDYFSNHPLDYKVGARLSVSVWCACKLQPWHAIISSFYFKISQGQGIHLWKIFSCVRKKWDWQCLLYRPRASGWTMSTNDPSCESWGGWSQNSGRGVERQRRDMRARGLKVTEFSSPNPSVLS